MQAKNIYIMLAVIFAATVLSLILLPNIGFIQSFAAVPLVGSLVLALFQVLRDLTAHERALLANDRQNHFVLGASSHMANVAFDKHAAFAEAYVHEVQSALATLFREGPTKGALPHAGALYGLRQRHALWLTSKMDNDLEVFESALRKIGASATYVANAPDGDHLVSHQEQMYKIFAEVMGWKEWNGEELSDERANTLVVSGLRSVLGTEELTEMRGALVRKAISQMRSGA